MEIKDLMNPSVVTIEPTASAALAARLLSRHNVGSLPVCGEDRRLRGMVTDRDIVLRCVAAEEDPAQTLVRDIMTRGCASVSPHEDCRAARGSWWASSPWPIWPGASGLTWRPPRPWGRSQKISCGGKGSRRLGRLLVILYQENHFG